MKITWPRNLAGTDDSKFIVVWPNNIDSKKTIPQGRRIAAEHACANPIVQEMSEVCQYLKLTHVMEPYKSLPRDNTSFSGRLKVQLLKPDGSSALEGVETRKLLMRKMGELIPKLNVRKERVNYESKMREMEENAANAGASKKQGKKKGKR
ncbi:signal recognition particle, SRP19 subunit [Pelagophyceae sp. CCMP2097]|nr:signal recognition particle, SRP19 subunit [Pelagophyceae sp. CCMP2097]